MTIDIISGTYPQQQYVWPFWVCFSPRPTAGTNTPSSYQVDPDPYVVTSIGSESWTTSTQHGKSVTWNEVHSYSNDYASTVCPKAV